MNGFNAARLVATIQLDGIDRVATGLNRVRGDLSATDQRFDATKRAASAVFNGVAATIGVATAATAGLLAQVVKTGIGYNALQQTSRAALSTILGGAEAANAQMDKLDEFARNSPFSKATFVQGQQQLASFGFEAEKLIPTLDSVQQAVAAVGGNNQQLSEVITIISKIRSTGKLYAEDFNELGTRGINAAQLLAEGFDTTSASIRKSVTEGTLDAGRALDVLLEQMSTKYAGATERVRGTIAGTTDRITAATRDIGAALGRPFVDPNGGGLAIQWGNDVADVLRAAERQVVPFVRIIENRASPAVAGLTRYLDGAADAVDRFDPSRVEDGLNQIGANGPAIAAVAGALLAANTQMLRGIPIVGALVPAFSPLAGIFGGLVASSPELRASLGDLFGTMQPLVPLVGDLATTISGGVNAVLPITASVIRIAADAARPLLELVGQIPAPVLGAAAAFVIMQQAAGPLGRGLELLSAGTALYTTNMAASRAVNEAMGRSTGILATSMLTARVAVDAVGNSLKAAFISNPVGIALLVISGAAAAITGAFAASAQKTQELDDRAASLRTTLHEVTSAYTAATQAAVANNLVQDGIAEKLDNAGLSVQLYTDAILGSDIALERFADKQSQIAQSELSDVARQDAEALSGLGLTLDDLVQSYFGVEGAREKVQSALDGTVGYEQHLQNFEGQLSKTSVAGENFVGQLYEQRGALEQAQREQQLYNEAVRQARSEMSDASLSNERLNAALEVARDVTRDATERITALKQALDELNGGTQTAAEQQRNLDERALSLAEALAQVDENGQRLGSTLITASGEIDTSSRAGLRLFDAVGQLNDEMVNAITQASDLAQKNGEAGLSMEEAARVAQPYLDRLRQIGEEGGLSAEQIQGLIDTQLAMPDQVAWALTDNGTVDETEQKLIQLALQIEATPDKTITISEPLSGAVRQRLQDLGYTVETLPDGQVKITSTGEQTVENTLAELTKPRTARISIFQDVYRGNTPGGVPYALPNADPSKDGNMYAGGQKVTAFANGGFPSGIYAGRYGGIHKFAELESGVPWEVYLSGRPSALARNQQLMEKVAPMLGMEVVRPGIRPAGELGSSGPGTRAARGGSTGGRTAPYIGGDVVLQGIGGTAESALDGLGFLLRTAEREGL